MSEIPGSAFSKDTKQDLTEELRKEFREHERIQVNSIGNPYMPSIFWNLSHTSIARLDAANTNDPDEVGSSVYTHEEKLNQTLVKRTSPARFCEILRQLDIRDYERVPDFIQKVHYGTPSVVPFPLFKHGTAYFYLVIKQTFHHPMSDTPREAGWKSKKESPLPCEYGYMTEFNPPITVPLHLRTLNDTEDTSTLRYGLNIGEIRCGDNDKITTIKPLGRAPFAVFLHPADNSFWIVFNSFPTLYDLDVEFLALESVTKFEWGSSFWGFWTDVVKSQSPVAVWRMPFSDVQRVALSADSVPDERVSKKGQPQDHASDPAGVDSVRPQVVVDGYDPAWDSFDAKHPRPIPCQPTPSEVRKYMGDLLNCSSMDTPQADLASGHST